MPLLKKLARCRKPTDVSGVAMERDPGAVRMPHRGRTDAR